MLPSPQPGSSGLGQLPQEGFDLHCLVWLFKYCSECRGNFRRVYPLLRERLKTHVSGYSPACLLCFCFHMQHARPAVWQGLGRAADKGEWGRRTGRREALGGDPPLQLMLQFACSPCPGTVTWGLHRGGVHCVGLVQKKDLPWENCPAETFHTTDTVSSFLLIPNGQTGK